MNDMGLKDKKKLNTLEIKYLAILEEVNRLKDQNSRLKDVIIRLQEDNDLYQKTIIEELELDIIRLRKKGKENEPKRTSTKVSKNK
jgi:hypothetical protein